MRTSVDKSRFRVASAVIAWILLAIVPSAQAFEVKPSSGGKLDGKVVVSPAAERVTTVRPDGGPTIKPGVTAQRYVIVQNRSKKPVTFDLEASQVVGSTAEEIVEVRNGVRAGAAEWVTLERPSFTLKPGETATVGLKIAVPKKVKPGSKPFAITVTQRQSSQPTEGAGVTPVFRQVAIFIVELPGEVPLKGVFKRVDVTSAAERIDLARDPKSKGGHLYSDKDQLTLTMTYRNDGERLLTPQGRVVGKGMFGQKLFSKEIRRFTVYPGGEAASDFALKDLPWFGLVRVQVELSSDAGKQTKDASWFFIVPMWLRYLLGGLLALLVGWQVVRWVRYRREIRQLIEDEASLDDGDELDDLDDDTDESST